MNLYDDPALADDPDYVAAPCGLVIHVDDEHDPDECERCEEQGLGR